MKCPVCEQEGKQSNIKVGRELYWMNSGAYYYHDKEGNKHKVPREIIYRTQFRCSEGHKFVGYYDSKTTVLLKGRSIDCCPILTHIEPTSISYIVQKLGYRSTCCCCPWGRCTFYCACELSPLNEFPEAPADQVMN